LLFNLPDGLAYDLEGLGAPPKSYRFQSCDAYAAEAFLVELDKKEAKTASFFIYQ
jgi:hypothetical protein